MNKKISKFCLGTWSLGGTNKGASSYGKIDKKRVIQILNNSYENGINTFDTASVYGNSEKILGQFIKDKRDKIIVASKVGCSSFFKSLDFKKSSIRKNLNLSLKNLNTDYIDICQLYNPNPEDKNLFGAIEILNKFKKEGKIKHIGISLQSPSDYLKLRKFIKPYMIQCNFNMLDQRLINQKILNILKKDNVKIFVRTVLNFGFFTNKFINQKKINFKKNDHRSRWDKTQIKLWQDYTKKIAKKINLKIEDTAIRFVLGNKNIDTAIIGVMNTTQLKNILNNQNLRVLNLREIKHIKKIYSKFENRRLIKPKVPMKSR